MTSGAPAGLCAILVLGSLTAMAEDTTPPDAGIVMDGIGFDREQQSTDRFLQASWTRFEDPESSPVTYEVAVGTAPDCANVENYRSVMEHLQFEWSVDRGTLRKPLTHGVKYFVTVKATNTVGLSTRASSDGVVVDLMNGSLPPPTDGGRPVCPVPPDAGVPDGGTGDGGLPDAGPGDGGSEERPSPVQRTSPLGWGCSSAGGLGSLVLLVLVMLGLEKGRRSH